MTRQLGVARIDIEHFAVSVERFVEFAIFLKGGAGDEIRQRLGFTFAFGTKIEIFRCIGIR